MVIAAIEAGFGAFAGVGSLHRARPLAAAPRASPPVTEDGLKIAFVRWAPHTVEPCDCPKDIYVMNVDGTGIHQLTHADPYMSNDQPAWSPDGTEIAYVNHWNTRGGSIYLMRADGTQVRRLTDSLDDWGPAWSPDGSKIAFTSGFAGLFVISADGTGLHRVFRPRGYEIPGLPVWSTDGTTVLFRMGNKAEMHLYAVGADGTGVRRVGEYDASFLPAWSPDRSTIAFSWNDQIYVMNADGKHRRELTSCAEPTCVDDDWPAWSPEAGRIVFSRTEPGGDEHVYVVNLDGTGLDRLTNGVLWDTEPAWQPSSKQTSDALSELPHQLLLPGPEIHVN